MERKINYSQLASEMTQTAFLNCYIRDIKQGGQKYFRIPKHDLTLASYFKKRGHTKWLKIELNSVHQDIYCSLNYYSLTGRHQYKFPCITKNRDTNTINELNFLELSKLLIDDYQKATISNLHTSNDFLKSLENSQKNTSDFLKFRNEKTNDISTIFNNDISFIDAEQALLTGHSMHPVPKSRSRMTDAEIFQYSPETKPEFQIIYFLANPTVVLENSAREKAITTELIEELSTNGFISSELQVILDKHLNWKLIPIHPWEIAYLKKNSASVKKLIHEKKILEIGPLGPLYTPTSSVRTLYNKDSQFMIKLSLHVKITNSERCNLYHELLRGCEVSALFRTEWGEKFKKSNPHFKIIHDPAYVTLHDNGTVIKGFNTSFRDNIKTVFNDKRVTMLGELCQDGVLGNTNRLTKNIEYIAKQDGIAIDEVSKRWFDLYLEFYLEGILDGYINFGMFFEAHGQNTMVELDKKGYPCNVYFRDSQGIIFRENKLKNASLHIPKIALESHSFLSDKILTPIYVNYIMISNIIGVVNTFGSNGLANESILLSMVTNRLKKWENKDDSGIINFILYRRTWKVKSNLLTRLSGEDEAMNPVDGVTHVEYKNPLLYAYYEKELLHPSTTKYSYEKYFEKEDIFIKLRPFDIDRDLEMVHNWFNRKRALTFWKMDGEIKDLEAFYISLLEMDFSHSYIGEVNGEASFTFEPYWAVRDVVGACYDSKPTDYGFHFLIATEEKEKRHTVTCLKAVTDYLFSFPHVKNCILEPDVNAKAMAIVLERAGFIFQKAIKQPHKNSNLFSNTKTNFLKQFPTLNNKQQLV
ncbi:siderophore synthetase component/RimJ/RimL family protein N-acetyltransferase [Wenyingzhuangia heitensis]|uniref:Siderophore synthetase component/RimJ/RimL family protein N-acetyltransferase n=1 Tax=Wenyingzhuangia heitensis TaxID=1487859 RepID=A0ABX0U6H3_9FLAO|nr:GNAT family N-acetyltransferase [Wenyingzhuangia heitensis]NIJ44460.1 siderophore synthetase component/RimJ/RimL family protein N-acetyltransferase [Wenyingzhuangia heitensis]